MMPLPAVSPAGLALPEGVEIEPLLAVLRSLAWGAADILQAYARGEQPPYGFPAVLSVQEGGEGPVTAADLAVNRWLLDGLRQAFPTADWTLLSEETAAGQVHPGSPLAAEWLWILDPLDGTKDFLQGSGDYAVHLALVRGKAPVLGVVLLPEPGELWFGLVSDASARPACAAAAAPAIERAAAAGTGGGLPAEDSAVPQPGLAWCEDRAGGVLPVRFSARRARGELVLVASRNHRDARLEALLEALALGDSRAIGSVGGKVASILRGEADLYISLSGRSAPKDWDMAAPHAVLQAAGGAFSHADGRPLTYNSGDIRQAGCLIASHGPAHQELCRIAAAALQRIDPGFCV